MASLKYNTYFNGTNMIKIDTNFVKLAINYLENPDEFILDNLAELSASEHIYYHCENFNPDPDLKFDNKYDFLKDILSDKNLIKDISHYKKLVEEIDNYADLDREIERESLKSLPSGLTLSSNMYVTLGYFSTGSVDGKENFNVDLTYGFQDIRELIYTSIHEFHHVGFSKFKKMPISSINDIKTHGNLLNLMIYLLHAEGLATYAPFYKMKNENKVHDSDYIDIDNKELMSQLYDKFIEYYSKLSSLKDNIIYNDDLMNNYLIPLDSSRLFYKFGLYVCLKIEELYGKENLIKTTTDPESQFVEMIKSLSSL